MIAADVGLTFDDVLLIPGASEVLPTETDVSSRVTREISVRIPVLSSAMDTVTEAKLAIAVAQAGGIGVVHRNLTPEQQADQVAAVKKFESGMVVNPVTIHPTETLADALELMASHKISGIPVVEPGRSGRRDGRLVGIVTNRDVRFATNLRQPVSDLMTRDKLVTVKEGVARDDAKRLLHQHRIEKLIVVDDDYRCIGLITVKDIEKAQKHPYACKDEQGRLRVADGDLHRLADLGQGAAVGDQLREAGFRLGQPENRPHLFGGRPGRGLRVGDGHESEFLDPDGGCGPLGEGEDRDGERFPTRAANECPAAESVPAAGLEDAVDQRIDRFAVDRGRTFQSAGPVEPKAVPFFQRCACCPVVKHDPAPCVHQQHRLREHVESFPVDAVAVGGAGDRGVHLDGPLQVRDEGGDGIALLPAERAGAFRAAEGDSGGDRLILDQAIVKYLVKPEAPKMVVVQLGSQIELVRAVARAGELRPGAKGQHVVAERQDVKI
jgi:IMP dehydrogenase/GMP reductase